MFKLIEGKVVAQRIRDEVKNEVLRLQEQTGKVPGLAVVLVGNHPASETYVRSKINACKEVGIESHFIALHESTTEEELLLKITELNNNPQMNGILVQLPLPGHINENKIIDEISRFKDVDGFHPENIGRLWSGQMDCIIPCTPAGIIELLKSHNISTRGKHVVILGRSNIVGKPLAGLFLHKERNSTVTVCHSNTTDITFFTKTADILISAVGRPNLVKGDMVKEGVVVVDVGMNRVESADSPKGYILCGDVDFESVSKKSSRIMPVLGGVGPMTVAMLMQNTLFAFKQFSNVIKKEK